MPANILTSLHIVCLLFALPCTAQALASGSIKNTTLLLDLYCNGEKTDLIVYAISDEYKKIWISEKALHACHMPIANKNRLTHEDMLYFSLDDIPEGTYLYDSSNLTFDIIVPSILLPPNVTQFNTLKNGKIRPLHPGTYINYETSLQYNDYENDYHAALLTDFVYFNYYGVGNASFLDQSGNDYQPIVRLRTNWTLDQPEKISTWRFGDSITSTANWSGAVQFGGVQYATNFATQPGFVTFPLPAVSGQASIPSTVNFYLDNQLARSQMVSEGPYQIDGLPVVTGASNIVVQTKDLLGRQTITAFPYYISQKFLQPGLQQFSYEIGLIRENYGINSNDYSQLMLVGTHEYGLTNHWTAGWHAELLSSLQTFGISNHYIYNNFIEFDIAGAASHISEGLGGLILLGTRRQTPWYNVGFQAIMTSHNFSQLPFEEEFETPKLILQSNISYLGSQYGSISLSYTSRLCEFNPNISIATLSYDKTISKNVFFIASYAHQTGDIQANSFFASFIYVPKVDYSMSVGVDSDQFQHTLTTTFIKNLPTDNGYGYRLVGAVGSNEKFQSDFSLITDYGLYNAYYANYYGTNNIELDAAGSLVYFAGEALIARKIDDSFVLVEVPELPNIPVYLSNQYIATTNANGFALIPQALSYDDNIVSINPAELPFNTNIQASKINVSPYFRSGAYIQFPISKVYTVSFNVVTRNGDDVPAGAAINLSQGIQYYVGYEGKVFISENSLSNKISGQIQWEDGQCEFSFELPQHEKQLAWEMGSQVCS